MPAWTTLTVRDLEAVRHADLIEAARRKALSVGQPDPVAAAIVRTVEEIRGCIAFSGRYQVDADPATLPPNLVDLAVQKIARVLMPRLGRGLSEDEREDEKAYQQRLAALRDGRWPVSTPSTPADEEPVKSTRRRPAVGEATRTFTRSDQDGI